MSTEWLYVCIKCGNRVEAGIDFAGVCPECRGTRWLCHLQNPIRKDKPSLARGYQPATPEFCPPKNNAVASKTLVDKMNVQPTDNGVRRGRPLVTVPDDLILQLSNDGFGAIRIAEKLKEKGIIISYKTVQRRLQASLL